MVEREVKAFIIEALRLEDIAADDIDSELPLFGDGLGLDSIDALELGVALEQRYGIALPVEAEALRRHTASVRALAALIDSHRSA